LRRLASQGLIKEQVEQLLRRTHADHSKLRERAAFLKQRRLERRPLLIVPTERCAARIVSGVPPIASLSTAAPLEARERWDGPLLDKVGEGGTHRPARCLSCFGREEAAPALSPAYPTAAQTLI